MTDFSHKPSNSNQLRRYYHVTPASNLASIAARGLLPHIGPRSQILGEKHQAIYLFATRKDAEDAVSSWFDQVLSPDEPLALIAVNLDPAFPLTQSVDWERISFNPVPPGALDVITTDF